MGRTGKRHQAFTPDEDWPPFIPLVCASIVAINLAGAVLQRHMYWSRPGPDIAFGYTLPGVLIAAGVIFLPYLLDAIGVFLRPREIGLPLWLFPVPVAAGVGYLMFHPATTDFAPFVLVFTAAEIAARKRDMPLFGLWGLATGVVAVLSSEVFGPFEGSFIWLMGVTFGWLGGYLVGELDRRKHELELAQAGLAEKAAADERSRIAREVHDVIAHSLSVTMLHVSAARMALERDRTGDALEALAEAERQGRNSLGEVRRTVGLLGPDESSTAAPMPGIADLPKLAADFRTAGLDVMMTVDAEDGFPAAAGLNVYRIVQEALTNAVKHAPGAPVHVELKVHRDTVHLRVHNPRVNGTAADTSGRGLGLRGMAERAALLGGELETDASDGWTITMTAPRPA